MNIVIENEFLQESDIETLFQNEKIIRLPLTDLPNMLVTLGVYKSTSQARNAGRVGEIPHGFTEVFKASKKVALTIWNPTE